MTEPQFVSVQSVATLLDVSEMTIYRLVNDGDLPAVRIGRSIRIDRRAVNQFLRNNRMQPGDMTSWAARKPRGGRSA